MTLSAQRLNQEATAPVEFSVAAPVGLTPDVTEGTLAAGASPGTFTAPVAFRADATLAKGSYPVIVHFSSDGAQLADATVTVVVGDQVKTLISTGFEVGEPQGEPNVRIDSVGWGDYCCSIGGAESKVQSGDSHRGSQAVVYSGRAVATGASATNELLSVASVPVTGGSTFSYSVYPQQNGGPFGDYVQNASQFVAVDLHFTDGTRLSSSGAVASNGAALDPLSQGSALTTDQWNDVSVTLPDSVDGKVVDSVLLSFSTGGTFASPGVNDGYLRGWVDDVSLTEPVAPLALEGASGLTVAPGEQLSGAVAHFTGGAGASASDFTATVDWADGSDPSEATIAADGAGGYTVSAAHAYADAGDYTATVSVTDADGVLATASIAVTVRAIAPVYDPSIQLTGNGSVEQGGTIGVSGTGFAPGERVRVSLDAAQEVATTVTADGSGTVAASLTVPREATVGGHTVTALGEESAVAATAPIAVTAAAVPPEYSPTVTLSAGSVAAGSQIGITGSGFAPGETVTVTLHSDPVELGTLVADADGAFSTHLSIPASIQPGAHEIEVVGAQSGPALRVALTITPAAGSEAAGGPNGSLANTGITEPVGLLALGGTLVLLLGGALLFRRRRLG